MNKNLKIILTVFLLLCVGVLFIPNKSYNFLHGSYLCKEQPHWLMTFNFYEGTFSYYYTPSDVAWQREDAGIYSKLNDGEYLLQSDVFKNTRIICENNSFYINVDGENYLFRRDSKVPTYLGLS